ncbi:MAG: molybdopterin molybdotransferase MoeA, partial [Pseudomonadales bacterium]
MAQNSQALDLAEAINQLKSEIKFQPGKETLPLEGALERILAAPVHAPLDMPPFPASAMDGYALRRLDFQDDPGRAFRVVGQSLAGHPYAGKVGSGEAVRIFTGAVVPTGADQIILQEELAQQLDEDTDQTRVQFKPHQPGESYVRPVAHDVAHGAQVASPGEVLNPFLFGALTSYGVSQVEVVKPIRVGVFSTGDELVAAGTPAAELQPGQIYDSNRATVLALLRNPNLHINDLGRIADDADQTREFLTRASADCDVLITSGGVSVGEADFVTRSIAELGRLNVWKLNLKPGKPMAVGSIGRSE